MDYRKLVLTEYRSAVNDSATATPELKAALKTSDRVPQFIDRLTTELSRAEMIIVERRGKPPKLESIKWAIRSMTETFLSMMEENAKNRMLSNAEKSRRERIQDEALNPEKYIAEMGVITDDPNEEAKAET